MQRHQPFQCVGQVGAVFGLALGKQVAGDAMGVGQVVDTGQKGAEGHAVAHDAADRNAAEADAMIGAFTADQARLRPLSAGALVG